MKIAILSDIHGNLTAFQTVIAHIEQWQPDHVIINGDIVNRGPDSRRCWELAADQREQNGWQIVRGNHEDYVLRHAQTVPHEDHIGIKAELNQNSSWTYQQVNVNGHISALRALPDCARLVAPDGTELRACHATMQSNQDLIFPETDEKIVRQKIAPLPSVFVTSHVHKAYMRMIDGTLLVNCGSAGQHGYGETRATYAQIEWQDGAWQADIIRLPYDMAETERAYYESGFMDETGPVARLIFYEWKTALLLLPLWRNEYQDAVLDGAISLETSVTQFLQKHGIVD